MARSHKNNPVLFDTLSYAKKLQAVGFTQDQAEVQAETFLAIVQEQLVSKRDLKELEREIKQGSEKIKSELAVDIEKVRLEINKVRNDLSVEIEKVRLETETVRKELKVDIEMVKRDLKIWFGGMLVVAVGVISAVITWSAHLYR